MSRLIATIVVLAALVIALAYYFNWFSVAKTEDKAGGGVNYNIHVDTKKMKADTKKAEEEVKDAGNKVKEKIQKKD
jgi:hypothetical protein